MIQRLTFLIVFLLLASTGYSQYVYKTKTGEKYHKETCHYLKYSKAKITLEDAIKKYGLEACKVCKPPKAKGQKTTTYKSSGTNCATVQCRGTTQKGARCKRKTKNCSGYCYQH